MGTAVSNIVTGRYVSTGGARLIELGFTASRFELVNYTNQNSVANPGVVKKAFWQEPMVNGEAFVVRNTNGAATDQSALITSGGFSLYDSADQSLDAALAITSITQAASAVVTIASHGYAVGDIVRFYGTTGMNQIGGMDFEVLTVPTANTFTINLNSSGFAAPATAGFARRLRSSPLYIPQRRFVVSITQASNAVVNTSIAHGLLSGQIVRLNVPSQFGMVQMDGLQGKVTRLSAYSFSIDINSSAFSAFAFPASAATPFSFAEMVPVGSFALGAVDSTDPWNRNYVPESTDNRGFMGMHVGATVVGAANHVVLWVAVKSDLYVNLN